MPINNTTILVIMGLLIGIIYLPSIIVILTWLPLALMARFYKNRSTFNLILGAIGLGLNKLTREGLIRFCIYKVSLFPSNYFRRFFYRTLGANIESRTILHFKTEIRSPWSLTIGRGTIIGDNAILDARSGLTIGENVNFSSNVSVYTLQHNHRNPNFDCVFDNRTQSVNIGNRVWLGSNVIVLPGVTIGEGAVVCAGAVVTKDVNPFDVVAGIPAKIVGKRPKCQKYEFNGKSCWFY